jgi:hypothetical protein
MGFFSEDSINFIRYSGGPARFGVRAVWSCAFEVGCTKSHKGCVERDEWLFSRAEACERTQPAHAGSHVALKILLACAALSFARVL